jgi:nucleotidyltransferase/DNA polymerase involved in DNA repair
MRIAFVSIPRFPCAVEIGRNPRLGHAPLIVGDAEVPKRVLDCSLSARDRLVKHGMTIRQATAYCPEANVVPPDPVLYRSLWNAILSALDAISPEIEDEEWGQCYLNVNGLQYHYRDEAHLCGQIVRTVQEESGLDASVGLATGKFPAFAASTVAQAGKGLVVAAGGEAEFIAGLTVDLLPSDEDTRFRLHVLGLDTIGDVAALSVAELQSQFGFQGKRLWELANGIDSEPLRPRRRSEPLQATVSLEAPVAGIDVMIALAKQLLSRLKPSLKGRAVRELRLQAELTSGRDWEHRLVFREPVSEDERLAFLLRSSLSNFPPPQAIRSLSLRLENLAGESGKQMSLDSKSRRRRHLTQAIQQLKTRYGYSPIYHCVDVEPWSVIPEERQILVESDA